jgi:magnesium-transporting ATPase (P-type)
MNRKHDNFSDIIFSEKDMRRVLAGQILLIICCVFYILWWYRGYRPGVTVSRVGGLNGMLLLMTAAFGLAGVVMSTGAIPEIYPAKINPLYLIPAGALAYVMLLLITRLVFHRVVTTELILIVLWTVLELAVINKLNSGGYLTDKLFLFMAIVIIAVFIADIILYVAYYRMEEMKAFYAAMVPLIAAAVTMGVLTVATIWRAS